MYQVNLFGQLIHVIQDGDVAALADEGDAHLYTCMRVADSPKSGIPPAIRQRNLRTPCEDCGEICWIDPKSFDSLRGMNLIILCIQCTYARVKDDKPET